MDSPIPINVRSNDLPAAYRLMRAAARLGLRLFYPPLRMLNRERLDQPGPDILLIAHPRSLSVALLLIATLDRRVHCLLPSGEVAGSRLSTQGLTTVRTARTLVCSDMEMLCV